MKSTSSPQQVASGVVLGLVLQPVSLFLVLGLITVTSRSGEDRGWAQMGAVLLYFTYFGMAQVLTILPAALLLARAGKHGIVRGLLGLGTFLSLANIAVLILIYKAGSLPIFGIPR